jgi:hypothetical protein
MKIRLFCNELFLCSTEANAANTDDWPDAMARAKYFSVPQIQILASLVYLINWAVLPITSKMVVALSLAHSTQSQHQRL